MAKYCLISLRKFLYMHSYLAPAYSPFLGSSFIACSIFTLNTMALLLRMTFEVFIYLYWLIVTILLRFLGFGTSSTSNWSYRLSK